MKYSRNIPVFPTSCRDITGGPGLSPRRITTLFDWSQPNPILQQDSPHTPCFALSPFSSEDPAVSGIVWHTLVSKGPLLGRRGNRHLPCSELETHVIPEGLFSTLK